MTLEKATAYSPETDTNYPSWDDLVFAETSGISVVAVCSRGGTVWPVVYGPFGTPREAKNAAARVRRSFKRRVDDHEDITLSVFVRPTWRETGRDHMSLIWLHRRGNELMRKVDGLAHLTASQEVKDELVFIKGELERKGFSLTHHCMKVRDGLGWRPVFFDLEGHVVSER